jgi:vacuolar-type H+-ATPase subunit H
MGTAKLVDKLEKYFDLSKKKQRKKHDKYREIISQLEKKKLKLKQKILREKDADVSDSRRRALKREFQVVSKLIRKAKRLDLDD